MVHDNNRTRAVRWEARVARWSGVSSDLDRTSIDSGGTDGYDAPSVNRSYDDDKTT